MRGSNGGFSTLNMVCDFSKASVLCGEGERERERERGRERRRE